MSTPDERRRQHDAALDELRKHYREHISSEEVKDALDVIRGAQTRGEAKQGTWGEDLAEVWSYLSLTRMTQKIAAGASVAVALLMGWVMFRGGELESRTPATWQSALGVRLPDTLRFRPGKPKATLEGEQFSLAGNLGGTLRNGTGLTSIDATFSGQTPGGVPVTFRGTLVLTNAPGVAEVRRRRDFVGATLAGELIIGTNAPVLIQGQPYLLE